MSSDSYDQYDDDYSDGLYDDDIYGVEATEVTECPECGNMDIFVCGTCQREVRDVRDSRYTVTVSHDFKILHSHLLEELEIEVIRYLNEGWQLTGNLHHVGYVDGTIEYMWGVARKGKE